MAPISSNLSMNIPSYLNLAILVPPAPSETISAEKSSANATLSPGFNLFPGLTIVSHKSSSTFFVSKNSILAPVFSLIPKSLAGRTFELFKTKQSPASKKSIIS